MKKFTRFIALNVIVLAMTVDASYGMKRKGPDPDSVQREENASKVSRISEKQEEKENTLYGRARKLITRVNRWWFAQDDIDIELEDIEKEIEKTAGHSVSIKFADMECCGCLPLSMRKEVSTSIVGEILKKFPIKTAALHIVALGSGQCLQDYYYIQKIIKAGYTNLNVSLIDIMYKAPISEEVVKSLESFKTKLFSTGAVKSITLYPSVQAYLDNGQKGDVFTLIDSQELVSPLAVCRCDEDGKPRLTVERSSAQMCEEVEAINIAYSPNTGGLDSHIVSSLIILRAPKTDNIINFELLEKRDSRGFDAGIRFEIGLLIIKLRPLITEYLMHRNPKKLREELLMCLSLYSKLPFIHIFVGGFVPNANLMSILRYKSSDTSPIAVKLDSGGVTVMRNANDVKDLMLQR